jgi:hypothetical protein
MYSSLAVNLLVMVATTATVALAALVHYEGLRFISARLAAHTPGLRRRKVLIGVYGVIVLHVAEIWLFGVTLWALLHVPGSGSIAGAAQDGLLDAIYLSATTFSTLGFGDVAPVGPVRFLSGTEALSGFILISWSASFLYLEMQAFWKRGN